MFCSHDRSHGGRGFSSLWGRGGGLNLIQVSVSAPQPGAEVLGLQLGLGEAPGLPFRPWNLSGQLAKPLFCSSPAHGRSRGRGLGFSGSQVGKNKLLQSNEHKQCLPGLGPEHQESPSQGGVLRLWLMAKALRRWLQEQWRSRAWRLRPRGPRGLLGSGCWQRGRGPRWPGLAN